MDHPIVALVGEAVEVAVGLFGIGERQDPVLALERREEDMPDRLVADFVEAVPTVRLQAHVEQYAFLLGIGEGPHRQRLHRLSWIEQERLGGVAASERQGR